MYEYFGRLKSSFSSAVAITVIGPNSHSEGNKTSSLLVGQSHVFL
jgi:hypothetical protein